MVYSKVSKNQKAGLKINEILDQLLGHRSIEQFFQWPPDAFALTSILLSDSGAYRNVVDPPERHRWPPNGRLLKKSQKWSETIDAGGERWRLWAEGGLKRAPVRILELINIVDSHRKVCVRDISKKEYWRLCKTILALHALADAACEGIGVPGFFTGANLVFYGVSAAMLKVSGSLSRIDVSRIKVLPKLRTPQVGISLRSLSHHLAVDRSEVKVKWIWPPFKPVSESDKKLNLMVIPWPEVIEPRSFRIPNHRLDNMNPDEFAFFRFSPRKRFNVERAIELIRRARTQVDEIHGVILPECALSEKEADIFQRCLAKEKVAFFIAGVRGDQTNFARFGLFSSARHTYETFDQTKHHRWVLDGTQIRNYHLGSSLHPGRRYWEDIKVPDRSLNFVSVSEWLTMCHLICEDLARHDPVTQLVRSVGPNLVVALLLDGPQLASRWPARYASVLADDPGSSVLTVTSLGMALRSLPSKQARSRVVALWKDSSGGPREIVLDQGADALILTLSAHSRNEWTADGREDGYAAYELQLSGIEHIRADS
ncbi:MAG: hypothetical protein HYW49_03580 [Deltaproteobacteria bacterium]|nr:hypothetical protein [Deltaproteobacteria bacterium]